MDAYEATRAVFSRIQNLDPENASKIMGLLLIQDHGEKEMIRLAFGPETLVHSVILKARKELGLQIQLPNSPSLSSSSPSTPPSPSPFLARQNSSSSRLGINGGFNLPSPLSIPNSSTTAAASSWTNFSHGQNQDELFSPSQPSLPIGSSSSMPFYGGNSNTTNDMMDEFQLQDQLSFLNDNCNSPPLGPNNHQDMFYQQPDLASSPTGVVDNMLHSPSPYWSGGVGGGSFHRKSFSVSDACFGSDDLNGGGFGWKPCMYFARGYCKNGTSCRFLHGGGLGESMVGNDGVLVESPNKLELMDQCPELIRSRAAQQQRLAAASQLMASSLPYSPKGMSFFLQQQQNDSQRAAAALILNEDLHKFGRSRLDRNEMMNPASRQIYLTFPADSTFREEDVTNYFSIYGPVEDVRIPYQQKRMFGFVTFVYPETVKTILAKGNPHFVCDARVLVKPYKEKGKVADKYRKQQHQLERGEFSPCGTPTGIESRDPFDIQLGPRMFYNAQDMLWRRKLEEQADLQQALELQSRRLMNLQLLDIKKHHHLRALSTGSPVGSPTPSPNFFNQNIVIPSLHNNPEEETPYGSKVVNVTNINADQKWQKAVNASAGKEGTDNFGNGYFKESQPNKESDLQENLEHNLPDSLFASPTKASSEFLSAFSNTNDEADKGAATAGTTFTATAPGAAKSNNLDNSSFPSASSPLDMSSFKTFNCQPPRFSSGHGAIGMSGGTGGPTCPVGI